MNENLVNETIRGVCTGNYGYYYEFKINVVENSIDIANNKSNVTITVTCQSTSDGAGNYGYPNPTYLYVDNVQKAYNNPTTDYRNRRLNTLCTWTGDIEHDADGTKTINVRASFSSSSANLSGGSANGDVTLSELHKSPSIGSVSILEQNTQLSSLGISNDTIVQYLSKKKFTISNSLYDGATLTNCSVYHNNVLIGTSSTNEVVVDFSNVNELLATNGNVGLMVAVTDSLNGYSTKMINYSVIKYTKPTLESTSTHIKRKTGNGVVLTDNKCNLNFVGTLYKENNLIGNNNTPTIEYKVWTTTEPSYSSVTPTVTNNNVTVSNYEVSNVLYTSVYNYKIRITDTFGNTQEKQDRIPTGISVWSEYKDRVNFLRATVENKDVLTTDDLVITSNEKAIGKWIDNSTIYRKVLNYTGSITNNTEVAHGITNLDKMINIHGFFVSSQNLQGMLPLVFPNTGYIIGFDNITSTSFTWRVGSNLSLTNIPIVVIMEYTKSS